MGWKPSRWCVLVVFGYVLLAPMEGYGFEPEAKEPARNLARASEETQATGGRVEVVRHRGSEVAATEGALREGEQASATMVAPVANAPTMPEIFLLLVGMSMTLGGAVAATSSFVDAAVQRNEAEALNRVLTEGGRGHSCTAWSGIHSFCTEIDRLNGSADLYIAIGVLASVSAGVGLVLGYQQLFDTRLPVKPPSPQVALTKVPGGGVLMFTGTF